MKSANEIKTNLRHFTGTTKYHKLSSLFPNFLLTDGAKFLAVECEAYWFLELIASYQGDRRIRNCSHFKEGPQFWTLKVKDSEGVATCEWNEGETVFKQEIPYTDFPLEEVRVYVGRNGRQLIAYLPTEH